MISLHGVRIPARGRARSRARVVLLGALLALPWPASTAAGAAGEAETRPWGTVRAISSGTHLLVVSPDRGQILVRLVGVELPEPPRPGNGVPLDGQPFGEQAAGYVRDLLLEKQVQLTTYGTDRAGRTLAVVWLGDINVNLTLVKEGLAWVDPALTVAKVRAPLEVAERQARVGKYGLWSLPEPEPPWKYRKRHRLVLQ